jgi:hypothetical protein
MYTGDRYAYCSSKKCHKKTKFVRCSNCNGKGPTQWTTCSNNCDSGYKCENGKNDRNH